MKKLILISMFIIFPVSLYAEEIVTCEAWKKQDAENMSRMCTKTIQYYEQKSLADMENQVAEANRDLQKAQEKVQEINTSFNQAQAILNP